jgi:hypothetical protein
MTENWHEIESIPGYHVSDLGRIKSKRGIIKGSMVQGYNVLTVRIAGKSLTKYVHKLVAEYFVEKQEAKTFVLHRDGVKANNWADNLFWATKQEMVDHVRRIAVRGVQERKRKKNCKLTEGKVRLIKKLLQTQMRLSYIAKQFGITHTQLNRIKKGENWGKVTI